MTKICAQKSHFHHFKMYKLLLNFAKKKTTNEQNKISLLKFTQTIMFFDDNGNFQKI